MTNSIKYFPLFVNIEGKEILVFGGGKIGLRRISSLLNFGVKIKVIAPKYVDEILALEDKGLITCEKREYLKGEIKNSYMVLAATDNHDVNSIIYKECKEKNVLINVASNQAQSDFFFPGIAIDPPIVVGVTANGQDHKKAKIITEKIKEILKVEV